MSGNAEFDKAAEAIKGIKGYTPSNEELAELYGLYKQSMVGDNETAQPGFFDLKGKVKWNAWNTLKGMSKADAQQKYVQLANSLLAKGSQ